MKKLFVAATVATVLVSSTLVNAQQPKTVTSTSAKPEKSKTGVSKSVPMQTSKAKKQLHAQPAPHSLSIKKDLKPIQQSK